MSGVSEFREEREAVDALIASGLLKDAPNMARLLSYVCTKYFEGQSEQVKEYSIAVEAFGRPADFDHKRDSIVRVEAHRLRQRLNDFYDGPGSSHQVKIVIPVGQYVPQFVRRSPKEAAVSAIPGLGNDTAKAIAGLLQADSPVIARSGKRKGALWLLAAVAAGGFGVFLAARVRPAAPSAAVIASIGGRQREDIRILAGWTKEPYSDRFGQVWQADHYAKGGYATSYSGHGVSLARDVKMFETAREGDFQYDIPLAPGPYELHLYFAEMLFGEGNAGGGGESSRIFSVEANGKPLLAQFDVIADAGGPNIADERVFKDISADRDGFLHLRFTHSVRDPLLNAIELRPAAPGRLLPVRILASEHSYVDREGRLWEADHYFRGGQLTSRPQQVNGASDPALYRGERYGNITYVIPVASSGAYALTLRFSERWFSDKNPPGGGAGRRLYNIFCNSQKLAQNFDIYKEGGGAERAVERTFHGLRASPQGKLVLYLQPVENYAFINAIEVLDESK